LVLVLVSISSIGTTLELSKPQITNASVDSVKVRQGDAMVESAAVEDDESPAHLTIINVQSYPTIGKNRTVMFNTRGSANLTITAVDGTKFNRDLEFLELRCGDNVLAFC